MIEPRPGRSDTDVFSCSSLLLEHLSQQTLISSISNEPLGDREARNWRIFPASPHGRLFASVTLDVSQHALETALGKLICDDDFRREFFHDAERAAARFGLHLTPIELNSLCRINRATIESMARVVDDRIRKAEHPGPRRRT